MMPRRRHALITRIAAAIALLIAATACSSTKHVPAGEYLLDKVNISIDDNNNIDPDGLGNFLRQKPNHKVLGFAKLQLTTYNLSGRDSTKWYNKWLRRVGQAPVIYDAHLTDASTRQLRQALINSGYIDASVRADTSSHGRKMRVDYHIHAGEPLRVNALGYNIADSAMAAIVAGAKAETALRPGMLLDRTALESERVRLTKRMRDAGYYDFTRESITYTADTVAGSRYTALTMNIDSRANNRYDIRRVIFVLDGDGKGGNGGNSTLADTGVRDTVIYNGTYFIYGTDRYLRPKLLDEMCYIVPGRPYSARAVERTYEALGRLAILKFIDIELEPAGTADGHAMLDAYIYLACNKKMTASVELEGTNSEGDLGFGVGLTYQHRNLAKGSELLTTKVRGSYESLSGNFENLINNHYTEVAGEVGITFPKFEAPFLSKAYKQRRLASTEFALTGNFQERPEYTRVIVGGAWRWKWQRQRAGFTRRQTWDLVDVNYVRLPRSTINFIDEIAPANPLLRYSYEDHFIMRMGYTFQRTNRRLPGATEGAVKAQPHVTNMRVAVESAGNLLYALSSMVQQKRSDGVYKILGIQYAQYVKGEFDYNYTRNFDGRNSLGLHGGFGIACPYGNSSMVPFEKRFYAGGANGVRGWGVRTLGPGRYDARNSVTDFINQCGDIRLDLSAEYRAKLFWVIEGAIFIDAGNIWTIRDYENQPGGTFRFNSFYKEIAAAYGVGIRLNFTYFILRFDLGIKAYNPAQNQEHWPLLHPSWRRDANFHFAVGYPF